MIPLVITIEGNIGSGKSTLCKDLENVTFNKPHKIIYENVDEWCKLTDNNGHNIFELYYSDKKKYSYLFQSYVICSRVHHILETIKEYPDHIIICERSHLTDFYIFVKMLHSLGDISDIEYKAISQIFKTFNLEITGTIYNKVDSEICVQRIKKRNRSGEQITSEYIKNLNELHNDWLNCDDFGDKNNSSILIIDGNIEKDDIKCREKEIEKIISFINELTNI